MRVKAESLDRRVRIEQPVANNALGAAGKETWVEIGTVWASVQDMLPSRGERLADGLNVATRPARVRMRYRSDVSASMRLLALKWDAASEAWIPTGRIMQIISVPAEIGRRDGLEMMVEDFSTQRTSA